MNDRVKLLAYRIFDPAKAKTGPDAKVRPEPEAKSESKAEAVPKTPSDLAPQIAKRAYELYERQGRHDGHAAQDWEQAEREIRQEKPAPEPHK